MSYVPQKLEINWTLPLTVKRFLSLTNKINKTNLDIVLDETEISHLLNSQMSELSGGEFRELFSRERC